MSFIFLMFAAPTTLIAYWVWCFVKGKRQGLLSGVLAFVVTLGIGAWAILQSRSSTAGIGFLFLPILGALAGGLAQLAVLGLNKKIKYSLAVAGLLVGSILSLNIYLVDSGLREKARNQLRDLEQKKNSEEITRFQFEIKTTLIKLGPQGQGWLEAQAREQKLNRNFLVAALERHELSPAFLEEFSKSEDLGILHLIAKNPNTPPSTLAKIYADPNNPYYFYQPLASNPNTPTDILEKLFENSESRNQAGLWLASNPSTPMSTLFKISSTKNVQWLLALFENPNFNCELLSQIQESLQQKDLEDDFKYLEQTKHKAFERELQCKKPVQ